jgi:hypothetical protein
MRIVFVALLLLNTSVGANYLNNSRHEGLRLGMSERQAAKVIGAPIIRKEDTAYLDKGDGDDNGFSVIRIEKDKVVELRLLGRAGAEPEDFFKVFPQYRFERVPKDHAVRMINYGDQYVACTGAHSTITIARGDTNNFHTPKNRISLVMRSEYERASLLLQIGKTAAMQYCDHKRGVNLPKNTTTSSNDATSLYEDARLEGLKLGMTAKQASELIGEKLYIMQSIALIVGPFRPIASSKHFRSNLRAILVFDGSGKLVQLHRMAKIGTDTEKMMAAFPRLKFEPVAERTALHVMENSKQFTACINGSTTLSVGKYNRFDAGEPWVVERADYSISTSGVEGVDALKAARELCARKK